MKKAGLRSATLTDPPSPERLTQAKPHSAWIKQMLSVNESALTAAEISDASFC